MNDQNENEQAVQIGRELEAVISEYVMAPFVDDDQIVCIPIIADAATGKTILRSLKKAITWTHHRSTDLYLRCGNILVYVDPDAATNAAALRGNTCMAYVLGEIPGDEQEHKLFELTMNQSLHTARTSGFNIRIFHV
jgi:hypothetical protein